MSEYLYVCHFSNGHIKVGRSINPKSRIASHVDRVACIGVELVEHHIAKCVGHAAPAEAALIEQCTCLSAKRNKNEWFEGLDYDLACSTADEVSKVFHPEPVINQGRQFWTGKEFDGGIPPAYVFRDLLAELSHNKVQEIARISGVPFTTLWKIRSGETTNPGIETVRKFAPHIDALAKKVAA